MRKIVIFGNSGSGKSTRAKNLVQNTKLAHLDLDSIAWQAVHPPQRMSISESSVSINHFLNTHNQWVVEGCYSDLLALVTTKANELIFLDLPTSSCITNARSRDWEPHKYQTKEAQDANLDMLIDWISHYDTRNDTFSKAAHEKLYEKFQGKKTIYIANEFPT